MLGGIVTVLLNSGLNNSSIFSPNNMQNLNLNVSSALYPQQNSFSTYSQPYQLAQNSLPNSGSDVAPLQPTYNALLEQKEKQIMGKICLIIVRQIKQVAAAMVLIKLLQGQER